MTKRAPVSVLKPIWYDAQQVDETDLTAEQTANDTIDSGIINNHIGDGVLPENLVARVLFDSGVPSGFLDGLPIQTQSQPSDNNLGNQLALTLSGSKASGRRQVKVGIIGLDFQSNLQYETFYFKTNETQISRKHFTKILLLLFNDFVGDPTLSFNLGGRIVISEVLPMTLSRDVIMSAQNHQPDLFFRDFFLDSSINKLSISTMLQNALPLYNIDSLQIFTQPLDELLLLSGDVTTQIGQKFQATTNNVQKITLLLSVRNQVAGQQNNLVWNGDIVVSIYPLQSSIDCPTDFLPNLPIDFSPSNIPIAQISYNYNSLQAAGVVLDSVPQPVDFIFSNSPIAGGNLMVPGQYYALTIRRSGSANQCDIMVATGQDLISNSRVTNFTGSLWVDIPDQDLWFEIWTDAAKVSDGQAYDQGHGVIIPKTTTDPTTQTTVDNVFGAQQFVGSDVLRAVLQAVTQDSAPVPDQRTGNPVDSRQQYVPKVTLMNTVDITNLEASSEPLILGAISDKNIKTFGTGQLVSTANLYSATMVEDELLIRVVDDATDLQRFDLSVSGLATSLLNGDLVGAIIRPDPAAPFTSYRIASARLCSMILGDVDGNGIIDENDLNILNSFLGYNLNVGLPLHTSIVTDGYTTQVTNGYQTLTQSFANLFSINFQLIDPNDGYVVATGNDGVLVANPQNPSLAQFTSATIAFNTIVGLSSYKLVVLNNGSNEADWGAWNITGIDSSNDVITIQKVFLTPETIAQMFRADINGDFAITTADGYLLNSYIERLPSTAVPPATYPAPSTNPYTKIGTRFNVIRLRLEELVDRTDDYTANPINRNDTVHPVQDIFINDGNLASHDFYHSPINMSFTKQLVWEPSLVVSDAHSKLVPTVFTSETGFLRNSCDIEGVQCNVYPVQQPFDPGRVDFFVPNNLIIGQGGELQRPDGYFYKVDFEVGTVILEIPDGLFGSERTIDIMTDFIVDYTGNGATRLGFPSMKFADCSYVTRDALANDQLRFSVAVQSFSPNTNGLDPDGYAGDVVDGKMGVSLDFETGLLTVNFTNLYQDPTLQTLSTKIQVNVFLKKGGFNNQPLFVDSTKVQNMLSLISVFSGANDGGPSALVDLQNDVTGILPILNGGTGLNAVGAFGTVLTSTGTGLNYQFVYDLVGAIPFSTGATDANRIPKTDGYGFLDPSFMYKQPVYVFGTAGVNSNDGYTPACIGAFRFRFDNYILEGVDNIRFAGIIETTNAANTAGLLLYNVNTQSYVPLNGSSNVITTTNTQATYVTSQDIKGLLSSGATDYIYEVHLNLNPGSITDTAICKMAKLIITYNNLTLNGSSAIAPPVAHSYNFVPFLPNPHPL
jgi:hypothetical protein